MVSCGYFDLLVKLLKYHAPNFGLQASVNNSVINHSFLRRELKRTKQNNNVCSALQVKHCYWNVFQYSNPMKLTRNKPIRSTYDFTKKNQLLRSRNSNTNMYNTVTLTLTHCRVCNLSQKNCHQMKVVLCCKLLTLFTLFSDGSQISSSNDL